MADVRALLRQQRSARRIDHPHAAYSDSGKLSCSVCREPVRLESAWDDHVRSQQHRTSITKHRTQPENALGLSDSTGNVHKRRRSNAMEDEDVEMGSDGSDERGKKRTRSDVSAAHSTHPKLQIQLPGAQTHEPRHTPTSSSTSNSSEPRKTSARLTPPLGHRSSGTPVHGIEMSIPSRPATPIATKDGFMSGSNGGGSSNGGSNSNSGGGLLSAASTPKVSHFGRSPLIPHSASDAGKPAETDTAVSSAAAALSAATSSAAATSSNPTLSTTALAQVDEDEWAAFEAEVVNAPAVAEAAAAAAAVGSSKPDFSGTDVISGAAVAADGTLIANGEETSRREAEEAQLVDEREEATRALEDEFEDMNALESRVRKLREQREALRSQPSGTGSATSASTAVPAIAVTEVHRPSATMIDKENIRQQLAAAQKGLAGRKGEISIAEESEEEDEGEDAGWDVFRFRA